MIFPPNSRALLPTFIQIFSQMGSHFAQNTTPNPCFYSALTDSFGNMYVYKTPPSPPQDTPCPGLNLEVGKMNYYLGNLDPTGQNV